MEMKELQRRSEHVIVWLRTNHHFPTSHFCL